MECPNCKHATSNTALLQCSHCGEAYERGPFEEYQHLEYLADWLVGRSEISQSQRKELLALVGKKQDMLLEKLLPKPTPEKPKPVEVQPLPAPIAKPIAEVKPAPAVVKAEAKPVVRAAISVPASKPKPTVAPKPAAPPKPKKPPIDWRKVITDAATSGALLRALLYLGAFMIVVSAAVLVIRFWDQFNPILQLVFIASIPLTFYAGGWLVRTRLKLTQAGTVLTGIGAILVAVDFAAIYQLAALGKVNGPVYWLIVTIFCTALYAFTARRTKGEFFDYLTLLAGGSVLFTFTRLLLLPVDWSVASITAAGTLMTVAASRFTKAKDDLKGLLRAARYLSQILIPLSVMYVILLPIKPPTGHMLAFLFATIGYAILAMQFPSIISAYAALAASIGTVVYGLRVAELPTEWYATVASILALVYIFIGQHTQRIKTESTIVPRYVKALNITGLLLVCIGALSGFVFSFDSTRLWAGVIGMTIAALDLAICAYIFGNSLYTLSASSLFILPFAIAFGRWFTDAKIAQPISWLTVAIGGLAFAYLLIGAGLRKTQVHARWLFAVGHVLAGAALFVLPFDYLSQPAQWQFIPALISLGIGVGNYLLSFILQHSEQHASLTEVSTWLPFGLGRSLFLWPIGLLIPIWLTVAWRGNDLSTLWLGATLATLGLAYIGVGHGLFKYVKEYRLPFHTYVYLLCTIGILIAIPSSIISTNADWYPLLTALLIVVAASIALAYLYNRIVETIFASLLFIWPFQLALQLFETPAYTQTLAYILLASLIYTPIAIFLHRNEKSRAVFHHVPVFIVGYALVAYAVISSVALRDTKTFIPWIGVVIPLIATALFTFSASYFRAAKFSELWAWAGTLTFSIAFGQSLTLFKIPANYVALAWVGIAAFYMLFERTLFFASQKENRGVQKFWSNEFHQPWTIFAFALTALGLFLSLPDTLSAFVGTQLKDYLPLILTQVSVVALVIVSARLYQNHWLLYIEPFIAFLPTTLFFIGYGKQIFGEALTTSQYALTWTTLGAIHLIAGTLLDRAKVRYSHGLYLGGYIFLSWAVVWSLFDRTTLVWTFGLWILAAIASALLVHFNRHQTWDDFIHVLFGKSTGIARIAIRNLFQWLAAWTFPIWCVVLLFELDAKAYSWLGLVVPPLAYLGLVLWFRRINATYITPLFSAAQFFTVIGLLVSLPTTFEFFGGGYYTGIDKNILVPGILIQAIAVLFYSASAWISQARGYAHIASWLSIIPVTIAWRTYGFTFTYLEFVIPWLLWATILIGIGFALDKNKVRYSHGPYFVGYALSGYALAVSTTDRVTNIYSLAITIALALISYITVHYGRHHSYEDFIFKYWYKADETTKQIASTFFLFFAAYSAPVLLTQILAHIEYPLAWRGVWLAIAAPLYVAIGLFVSKSKSRGIATVPTWALYSAGYALTAIGPMVTFENETVATYVLVLNAIVYGVSAYIFRQSFWLYLSTVLTPIIALLILHQTDRFTSPWVAWIFIALAYIYLAFGQIFDRVRNATFMPQLSKGDMNVAIHPFAAPFYAPGFLLSAIALAVASSDRNLAIQIYLAGVILYALSAWIFRETLFIYPATWLAAVPYYLLITLTSLEVRWYGLAWLPLIVAYIAIGRIFFHKEKLAPVGQGMLVQWLTHPAIPFYLLAYALSISMISLSYVDPLPLTIAFGVAALLYFTSAYLFKKPAWIYPGLFAAHMTVLAYFTIDPSGGPARYITIPFLAMTWLTSLIGYAFERRTYPVDAETEKRTYRFSIFEHLFGHPWARPFFAFAIIEMVIWQSLALTGTDTTIIVASGYALLFALFSLLWMEGTLVYGAVGFGLLAAGAALKQAEVQFADAVAVFGGIGFGLYLLGRILDLASARFKSLSVWLTPLTNCAIALTAAAVLINLPAVTTHQTALAATLAFAGALYVTIAYRGQKFTLGYLGMALLQIAWVIVLFISGNIDQPQLYAIPAGLYFMGIAYLELRRERKRYAVGIEILGLGVLLVTSFIQSLNGKSGLPYFVLLLVEALLVIWWGTLQKRKVPFFAGLGFSALNILAQLVVLVSVYDINRWFVAFGAGIFIMGVAIYIERSREQLRARVRELSETLEAWE